MEPTKITSEAFSDACSANLTENTVLLRNQISSLTIETRDKVTDFQSYKYMSLFWSLL